MADEGPGVRADRVVGSVSGEVRHEPLPDEEEEEAWDEGPLETHAEQREDGAVGEENEHAGGEVLHQIHRAEAGTLGRADAKDEIREHDARHGQRDHRDHVGEELAKEDREPRDRAREEERERLRIDGVRDERRTEKECYERQEISHVEEGNRDAVELEPRNGRVARGIVAEKSRKDHREEEEREHPEAPDARKHALECDLEHVDRRRPERARAEDRGVLTHFATRYEKTDSRFSSVTHISSMP